MSFKISPELVEIISTVYHHTDFSGLNARDCELLTHIGNYIYSDELRSLIDNCWEKRGFEVRVKGIKKKMDEFKENFSTWINDAPFPFTDKKIFIERLMIPTNLICLTDIQNNWEGYIDQLIGDEITSLPIFQWIKPKVMTSAGTSKDGRGELFLLLFGRDSRLVSSKEGGGDLVICLETVEVKQAAAGASIKPKWGNGGAEKTKGNGLIDQLTKQLADKLEISTYVPIQHRPSAKTNKKTLNQMRRDGSVFDFNPADVNPFTESLKRLPKRSALDVLYWYFSNLYNDKGDINKLCEDIHQTLGQNIATSVMASFVLSRGLTDHTIILAIHEESYAVSIIRDFSVAGISTLNNTSFRYIAQRGTDSQSVPDGSVNIFISISRAFTAEYDTVSSSAVCCFRLPAVCVASKYTISPDLLTLCSKNNPSLLFDKMTFDLVVDAIF